MKNNKTLKEILTSEDIKIVKRNLERGNGFLFVGQKGSYDLLHCEARAELVDGYYVLQSDTYYLPIETPQLFGVEHDQNKAEERARDKVGECIVAIYNSDNTGSEGRLL
jgi:hypothetical protein